MSSLQIKLPFSSYFSNDRKTRKRRYSQSDLFYIYAIFILKILVSIVLLVFFIGSLMTVLLNTIHPGFIRSLSGHKHASSGVEPACRLTNGLDYFTCLSTGSCCGDKTVPQFQPVRRNAAGSIECHQLINVVYMACRNDKLASVPLSVKSLVLFTRCPINIILLTEPVFANELAAAVQDVIAPFLKQQSITFEIKELTGHINPEKIDAKVLNPTNATHCTGQLMYLPIILEAVDAVIYLNADTIFLAPVEYLWANFDQMRSKDQVVAMTSDFEDPDLGYYNNIYTVPFIQPLGVNAGVILMNLTSLRLLKWENHLMTVYSSVKDRMRQGTQDLLNAFFQTKLSLFKLLSCEWNFRNHHCYRDYCNCRNAKRNGISLIHQQSHYMQNSHDTDKRHLAALHSVFMDYAFEPQNPAYSLVHPLRTKFSQIVKGGVENCNKLFADTLSQMQMYLASKYGRNTKRKRNIR